MEQLLGHKLRIFYMKIFQYLLSGITFIITLTAWTSSFVSASALGYNCGQYNVTTTYNGDCGTIISSTQIGSSTNCIANLAVTIGNTFSCQFPLSGNPLNTYLLPINGIVAKTLTATGNSQPCIIQNNSTTSPILICASIPSNGGATGQQQVVLYIDGSTSSVQKGFVTLSSPSGQGGTVITYPNISNSTNCNRFKSIYVGSPFKCAFLLSGDPLNTYFLPANGIQASISSGLSNNGCNIENNGTASASLICDITSSSIESTGEKQVVVFVDGKPDGAEKGNVVLVANADKIMKEESKKSPPTSESQSNNPKNIDEKTTDSMNIAMFAFLGLGFVIVCLYFMVRRLRRSEIQK
jgi:hypothetical protein